MLRLLFSAVALLIPAGLRAECMMIQPFVAGPEVVPPDPRLVLFWPREYYPKAPKLRVRDQRGRALAFALEPLSRTRAYDSYSLKVAAAAGTEMTIEGDEEHPGLKNAFRVDSAWSRRPAPEWDFRVRTSTFSWPCSFERVSSVSVPAGPAAYRVEWTPAGGGRKESLVVPARSAEFFSSRGPLRGGRDEIKLGHLNCSGWNFRWDDAAIDLKLVGLQPDGGEDPSPSLRLEAPPRLGAGRHGADTPEDLMSPMSAWESLLSALQSGRPEAVERVATRSGWGDLKRALGDDPDRLAEAAAGWSATAPRFGPIGEKRAEVRWGPDIKEQTFRFALVKGEWRLDGWSAGE